MSDKQSPFQDSPSLGDERTVDVPQHQAEELSSQPHLVAKSEKRIQTEELQATDLEEHENARQFYSNEQIVTSQSDHATPNMYSKENHRINEEQTMHWFDVQAIYYIEMEEEERDKVDIQMLAALAQATVTTSTSLTTLDIDDNQ